MLPFNFITAFQIAHDLGVIILHHYDPQSGRLGFVLLLLLIEILLFLCLSDSSDDFLDAESEWMSE